MSSLKDKVRIVENFPTEGVSFKDITPILNDEQLFKQAIVGLGDISKQHFFEADILVGIESRGFIFASALAFHLNKPLHLVRKKGKLPPIDLVQVNSVSEYAEVTLETTPGKGKALIIDDVLATGGTLDAVYELLEKAGFETIGSLFLINLASLNNKSKELNAKSLIEYND